MLAAGHSVCGVVTVQVRSKPLRLHFKSYCHAIPSSLLKHQELFNRQQNFNPPWRIPHGGLWEAAVKCMKYRVMKESLCTSGVQWKTHCIRTVPTQLMIWRWPSQNTFGMWTQFIVSINVWRLAGDALNITCNFLYCNYQVHRDFLITLYYLKCIFGRQVVIFQELVSVLS
jgi:hypothetical protein